MIDYGNLYVILCILWTMYAGLVQYRLYGTNMIRTITVNYLLCPLCMVVAIVKALKSRAMIW